MMILVTGGSGSGKSLLAEQISIQCKQEPLYYLATMQVWDEECKARIIRHQNQRMGKGFQTIEVPHHLFESANKLQFGGSALLDCISNLIANEQFDIKNISPAQTVIKGVQAIAKQLKTVVIVTNEVTIDCIPTDPAMRSYLRNIGTVNCELARISDIVIEVCSGIPIFWKGEQKYVEIMG